MSRLMLPVTCMILTPSLKTTETESAPIAIVSLTATPVLLIRILIDPSTVRAGIPTNAASTPASSAYVPSAKRTKPSVPLLSSSPRAELVPRSTPRNAPTSLAAAEIFLWPADSSRTKAKLPVRYTNPAISVSNPSTVMDLVLSAEESSALTPSMEMVIGAIL